METNYSVLMSAYYKEKPEYLRCSMESMFEQSILTNDFVLVCDGPLNDELDEVIAEMQTQHGNVLHVVRLEKNAGLGNALNVGLRHCKNELVARMDSDDISKVDRCERQLKLFEGNSKLDICSGTVEEFEDSTCNIIGKRELPGTNEEIKLFSRKRNPFNHPTVMFKKSAVVAAGEYNEDYHLFEDYYLWVRMLQNGANGQNLKETLLYMRTPHDIYMRRGGKAYAKEMLKFHQELHKSGWTSKKDYWTGAVPHVLVCVLPNRLRKVVYRILH